MKKHANVFVGILLFCASVFADDLPVADSVVVADDAVATTVADKSPPPNSPPRIAVYVTGSVDDNEKRVLGTRLQTALIMSGRYADIERHNAFLAEIEAVQAEQPKGVLDNDQISEIGRRFGVNYVCVADVTSAFGEHNISGRIINVENVTVSFAGTAHGPLQTMDDLVDIANGVVRSMFGVRAEPVPPKPVSVPAPVAVAPSPAPVAVAPPPPPVSVSVSVSAPLPAPIALRTGTSMADRAKAAAAEKMIETVMSQITPQIRRMVASASVSAEVKADAEQRLTITARNIVTTALNDAMGGRLPNPKDLVTLVMGEITSLAIELLGTVTIDIEISDGDGIGGSSRGKQSGRRARFEEPTHTSDLELTPESKGGGTRVGMRLAYNASNSYVDIREHNRIIQSKFGSGWELGFVLNTSISDVWIFNYGVNMAFRAPVNSSNLRVTETALSAPLMLRLITPPNTSWSIFGESGFIPGAIFSPKDDYGRRISQRKSVDFAFVVGGGFGIGSYFEFDSKVIWSMVDYVDVQFARRLAQISSGLTIMFKERR